MGQIFKRGSALNGAVLRMGQCSEWGSALNGAVLWSEKEAPEQSKGGAPMACLLPRDRSRIRAVKRLESAPESDRKSCRKAKFQVILAAGFRTHYNDTTVFWRGHCWGELYGWFA